MKRADGTGNGPISRTRKSRHGQATVEFAMVVPLFFLLIFGMIDIGRLFFVQVTLQNAMRQAGRYAVTGNKVSGQSRVDSITQVAQQASVGTGLSNIQITSQTAGVTSTNGDAGGPGATVTISLTTQLKLYTPLIGRYFGTNGVYTFTVSTTFRNEPFDPSSTH
jgi:Flp pilus assembly protein TadG